LRGKKKHSEGFFFAFTLPFFPPRFQFSTLVDGVGLPAGIAALGNGFSKDETDMLFNFYDFEGTGVLGLSKAIRNNTALDDVSSLDPWN
jgi:hypothetical protein